MTAQERTIDALKHAAHMLDSTVKVGPMGPDMCKVTGWYGEVQGKTIAVVLAVYISRALVLGQFKATR